MRLFKIIFLLLFIFSSFNSNAQKNNALRFGVGAELAAVTGDLNKVYSFAVGATAQADYMVDNDLALTLNAGVISLKGKKIGNTNTRYTSTSLIPLLVGIKYYFIPKVYGSAQLGTSLSTRSGGGSTFTYAPGLGYKLNDQVDLLVKYTGYSGDGGTFGIRLGYTF